MKFSEGRKAVYSMKMERKMFGKQMFSGYTETIGLQNRIRKKKRHRVSQSPYLVHAILIYDRFLEEVPCLYSLCSWGDIRVF